MIVGNIIKLNALNFSRVAVRQLSLTKTRKTRSSTVKVTSELWLRLLVALGTTQ
jgi:hypothetical protein